MSTPFSVRAGRTGPVIQAESIGALNLGGSDEPAPIPEPELRLPQHDIVGRAPLLAALLADMQAGLQDFALEFLPGIGKTTVAAELIRDKAVRERFADGVLWAHLGQTPDVRGELLKWADAVGLDEATIAKRRTDADLSRAIESRLGERKVLLVIDDVWTSEAGQYFMLSAPGCVRVLTSRQRGVARELSPDAKVYLVSKLSPADSLTLLRALAPAAATEDEALRTLAGLVDGMPLALVLLGKMLRNHEDDPQPVQALLALLEDTRRMFLQKKPLEYSEDQNVTLEEVVESGYKQLGTSGLLNGDALNGDALREAALALSVLRPDPVCFDETLALRLAEVPPQALRQLAQAGLLERRISTRDGLPRYTMHRVIAECLRDKLPDDRMRTLNARAADHYLQRLHALEEGYRKRTPYLGLYRYENRQWREAQDNWLYHFTQAGYSRQATLAFLRAWFTAFWWWSCFTDDGFDFCDQLLNEWDHRLALSALDPGASAAPLQAASGERLARLREGLDLLRRFRRAYPQETEDRSGGDWGEVRATLEELRHRVHLDGALPGADEADACTVRGLTSVFLAEAARMGRHDAQAAEALYRDALEAFATCGDEWDRGWVLYHLADLLDDVGRAAAARALCDEALTVAEHEGDPELRAQLCRVLGDLDLAAGEPTAAQRHYAQAVEWAYRFQVEPESPDAYTIAFYPLTAHTVAERVLRLHASQPAAAREMALRLQQPWARAGAVDGGALPDLVSANAAALAAALFPPPLPPGQLATAAEAYAAQVARHLRSVAG
jgi:hypothetical protein